MNTASRPFCCYYFGAQLLCARCGVRRSRLRHSAAVSLLSKMTRVNYNTKMVSYFGLWIRAQAAEIVDGTFATLRPFASVCFLNPFFFAFFSSRFRPFLRSAPHICWPAAELVPIDFAPLRPFHYF